MKKYFFLSLSILSLLSSCSTDFDLTSDWKDITVVYGLLDKNEDTTFIKITKAFLDKTTSAVTVAQNPDSLFYTNLDVWMKEYSKGNFQDSFPLSKIDGNLIGHQKEGGTFASGPNFLYMTTKKLNQDRSYKLVIRDGSKVVSSSTEVVNDFNITVPGQQINFFPGRNTSVKWISAKDGKVYGLTARFHYREFDNSTNQLKKDTYFDWVLFQSKEVNSTIGGEEIPYSIEGNDFFNVINNRIGDDPNVYRTADALDLMFSVAGDAYYTYTQIANAQTGLTSGQIEPAYSNIDNGIGLFSSRTFENFNGYGFSATTLDSLSCGHITRHLRFKNHLSDVCP